METKDIFILYVEDDIEDAEILAELLTECGINSNKKLTVVNTLKEAFNLADHHKFNLIFLDLNLPDSNGMETYKKLAKKYPELPIVIMTGLNDIYLSRDIVSMGAQDFLVKGEFSAKLLMRVIWYAIERKNIQQKLHNSEERFNLATEYASVGIWDLNLKEDRIYYSDIWKKQIGYLPDELEDKFSTWENLLHPDDHDRMIQEFADYLADPSGAFVAEFRLKHKNGSYVWISNRANSYKDANGRVIRMLGAHVDITENKEFEEQLKLHREHIRLINKILRHDLMNNFASIKAHTKIFKDDPEPEHLEGIENFVSKSLQLISRMRELESFIETNLDLKMYQVENVIRHAAEKYSNIELNITGKAQVMADDTIDSIFDNIIGNAIKHGKTSKIDIDISEHQKMCLIHISDYGVGIPKELKNNVFEENFIHGDTGGTGLGLYIVKTAMERYGGSVFIEDNVPHGTIFVLMFHMV